MATSLKRNSGIELLRILAMFMVMFTHANFLSGTISLPDFSGNELNISYLFYACIVLLLQSITTPAVDVFVLISGYFGIRYSGRKLASLLFTVFFFLAVTFACKQFYMGGADLWSDLPKLLFWGSSYWFVYAYILLFVLSPFIEAGIKVLTERAFRLFLILFFAMVFVYGWVYPAPGLGFEQGHTTISFIGLYLLGRYVRLHPAKKASHDVLAYVSVIVSTTLMSFIALRYGQIEIVWRLQSYCAPLIVMEAVLLLRIFSNLDFCNKGVNLLAISSFSVYLLHGSFFTVAELYVAPLRCFHEQHANAFYWIFVLLFAILWYFMAFLLDRGRIYLWNKIENKIT